MDLDNILFLDHPNPMLLYNTDDLSIVKANKVFLKTYGYSETEVKGLTLEDIRPEEDIPFLHQKVKDAFGKTSPVESGTVRHQTKSGKLRFVQVTSQQFEQEGSNLRIAHIHDITDTVELKNKYKNTLGELVHHIDENPLAMVKFDRDLNIIDWSKKAEEKLGFTADEVTGKTPFDIKLFQKDEHKVVFDNIGKIIQDGTQKARFETIALHKEGNQIHVRIHASVLKDSNNKLRTLVAFIENITPEKRIEQLFQTTEQMAQMGGWEYNPHSDELYWTDQVYRIHEVPLEERISVEKALSFYLPEDKKRINELFESLIDEGNNFDLELQIRTGQGNTKWVRVMGRPVMRNGKLFKVVGIFADIEDQKAKRDELLKKAKEKEILLSEIHHRVKNNLAIISGLLELKSMEMDDEKVSNIMLQSQLRIQSMGMIHEKLYEAKDFSNLEFANFTEDLVDVIKNAYGHKDKTITITIDCDDAIKLNVNQAIPCGLIINELVTNSLKHAFVDKDKGSIHVNIHEDSNDELRLTVIDNGQGLPDKFIDGKIKTLGAQLIRQLAQQLEGELNIHNNNGAHVEVNFRKSDKSGSSSQHFDFN
jgi:PAS domain S-box-containing protein